MINNNIVGYCFPNRNIDKKSPFDIGEFFTRILLFDKIYLKSNRLNEISSIIQSIGAEQTIELVNSGSLKFIIDTVNLAATGQNTILKSRKEKGGPLPLGSYSFHVMNLQYNSEKTSEALANIKPKNFFIEKKVFKKIKLQVAMNIMESPDEVRYATMASINSDLRNNNPAIPYLINRKLQEKHSIKGFLSKDIKIEINEINEQDFKIESNLQQLTGIDLKEEHRVIQSALLALGTFNRRLLEMKAYDSITCFDNEDYSLFDEKYMFLCESLKKQSLQSSFNKIIRVVDLPNFSEVGIKYKIDIVKLLQLKKSEEFVLFREFLRDSSKFEEKELKKVFKSLKAKFSTACDAPFGKTARFLFGAGVGLIPIVGTPLSAAISVADQYLFEKLLPSKGTVSFIRRGYPSIFKE